jgi:hypothetical protein
MLNDSDIYLGTSPLEQACAKAIPGIAASAEAGFKKSKIKVSDYMDVFEIRMLALECLALAKKQDDPLEWFKESLPDAIDNALSFEPDLNPEWFRDYNEVFEGSFL